MFDLTEGDISAEILKIKQQRLTTPHMVNITEVAPVFKNTIKVACAPKQK